MVRPPCCEDTSELTKGPWSKQEDKKLIDYIGKHGHENWRVVPKRAGLNRCGKSCRLRWINYLRPDIKRGNFTDEEEQLIIKLHSQLGSKWSRIATHLPGRTDNEIKNHWNTRMRKKLIQDRVDTRTHQLLLNPNLLTNLSLLKMIAYPNWDNVFNPAINFHLPQNLMPMINQTIIDPTECLLGHALDYTNQLQLSQSLTQIINPKPFPNLVDSFGGVTVPQQEFAYETNNMVNNTRNFNTLPSVSNLMSSFDCDIQPKNVNMHYNGLNTDYISDAETSLPNLFSIETPNIISQVESDLSLVYSPSSNIFEDLDKFWDDESM